MVVKGDLDLSKLKKNEDGKVHVRSLKIENSDILGVVNIENTVILVSANFKHTEFKGRFRGMGALFRGRADFEHSHFYEGASFGHADFASYTNFEHAQFHKATYFTSTKFDVYTDFRHACFHREAHFDNMQVAKNMVVTKKIRFDEVHFIENVSFVDAKFGGNVNFVGARFGGDVNFLNAQFAGVTRFEGAQFGGVTRFKDTCFKEVVFFGGRAHSKRVQFSDYADFESAQFCKYANFNSVRFSDYANFEGAQFSEDVEFKFSHFCKDANFGKDSQLRIARFNGNTDFFETEFNGYADFQNAHFGGDCKFENVRFGEAAIFVNVNFGGDVLLSHARFKEDAYFLGASFDKNMKLERTRFIKGEFEIEWSAIKDHLDCDNRVYLALVKNFKDLGWFDEADDCYYKYREKSQKDESWCETDSKLTEHLKNIYNWPFHQIRRISAYLFWFYRRRPIIWIGLFNWSKLFNFIAWISCGYGVKVLTIVLWIFSSILGFASLYHIFDGITKSSPPEIAMAALNNSTLLFTFISSETSPSFWECLYFSALSFAGGTPAGLSPVGAWKYAVMAESVLGYLFLALFIVVLARKLIR